MSGAPSQTPNFRVDKGLPDRWGPPLGAIFLSRPLLGGLWVLPVEMLVVDLSFQLKLFLILYFPKGVSSFYLLL